MERSTSQSSPERTSNEISFPPLSHEQIGEDTVNMAHLDLFNHLVNGEWESFGIGRETIISITIRNADTAPYLMYEMLALSAQHLSLNSPEREEYYKNQAIRLQTRSITLFNSAIAPEQVTSDNCIPFFVFSSVLGMHHFCNVVRNSEGDFGIFIASLVNSLNLYRGLRTIVGSKWHVVSDYSALQPVLKAGTDALINFLQDENYEAQETESKRLIQLLEDPLDRVALGDPSFTTGPFLSIGLKKGLEFPYLLYQCLALSSSLHLAFVRPDKPRLYRHQAATLQTRALSMFNSMGTNVDESNCTGVLLISSFLGLHLLADSLSERALGSLDAFVAKYVQCIEIHRGVYSIAIAAYELRTRAHDII
ncbi:hypothetical protein PISL3812_04903 [Talaromyces islandicus]|uniref:Uncharacterized protein n=1 Tax=Talaromyces islandicus TaxID=28573 RepID=A0A0U1LXS0_TALIS|nr:hypothetical protein PISL3812_04903 [Talaromyces islandicus]